MQLRKQRRENKDWKPIEPMSRATASRVPVTEVCNLPLHLPHRSKHRKRMMICTDINLPVLSKVWNLNTSSSESRKRQRNN